MGIIKKKTGKWLFIAAILFILAGMAFFAVQYYAAPDYTELAAASIRNNLAADTYRFSSYSVLSIGSEQRCFADLLGEKAGAADRHIKGNLVGSELEIYFVDGMLYRHDTLSGKWIGLRLGELDNAVSIMAELEPALNFAFNSIGEVQFRGKEKLGDKSCFTVCFCPDLQDKWIKTYFGDIHYKLWIAGKREPQIVKAEISGVSLENAEAKLCIQLKYWDYDSDILLTAPQIGAE